MDCWKPRSIGCLQLKAKCMDSRANLSRLDELIATQGTSLELLVLPELFDVGYDLEALKDAPSPPEDSLEALSSLARKHRLALCGGLLEVSEGRRYNSLVFIDSEGRLLGRYRKICLFPLSREEEVFSPGESPTIVEWEGLWIGLAICFDIRFPELFAYYAARGCDLVIVASAFPYPRLDHWRILLQARAIEGQFWLAASNRSGRDEGLSFLGDSQIIDPWGIVRARAGDGEEELVQAQIRCESVQEVRKRMPLGPGHGLLDYNLKS